MHFLTGVRESDPDFAHLRQDAERADFPIDNVDVDATEVKVYCTLQARLVGLEQKEAIAVV